ncbi:MAG: CHASE3 domain-containing protein [Phycisphaerae bacterium]|nr:CHASE3 domain-containing protein [Phycisphaerae bacterium]
MKLSVGTKILMGFGLAVVAQMIIGVVAYRSVHKLLDNDASLNRSHQILEQLGNVASTLKDAETGQRGFVVTAQDSYLEPYQAAQAHIGEEMSGLKNLLSDDTRLGQLSDLINTKFSEMQEIIDLRKKDRTDAGFKAAQQLVLTNRGKLTMDQIRDLVKQIGDDESRKLGDRTRESQDSADAARATIIGGIAIISVLMIVAGYVIARSIAVPLRKVTAAAEQIASGDLSVNVALNGRSDEVGALAMSFSRMTNSLQAMASVGRQISEGDLRVTVKPQSAQDMLGNTFVRMIANLRKLSSDISEGATVLGGSAAQIVASTAQLASGSAQTATAVTETTTTVEEVRQTAQMASQKSKYVAEVAQKAAQISQGGRKNTQESAEGMTRIRDQMGSIAQSMVRLSEQTQAIGQIIATVDDLSQQSNLLAVNASIEAAKAGEQGKGFAVVAGEVKSLAEQSKGATQQVRAILSDIQKATAAAVMATEQGTKAVEAGVEQSAAAGESISQLGSSVSEASAAASQIAASSQQQLVGMEQVAAAMENIKQASNQNVDSARQLDAAARNLSSLGDRLKGLVSQYKL